MSETFNRFYTDRDPGDETDAVPRSLEETVRDVLAYRMSPDCDICQDPSKIARDLTQRIERSWSAPLPSHCKDCEGRGYVDQFVPCHCGRVAAFIGDAPREGE